MCGLETRGIGFRSLTEAIDTTPGGTLIFHLFGALAQFEHDLIHERTRAGLAAARSEGRVGSRLPKLRANQRRDIAENILSGRHTGAQMARLYGVSPTTVPRIVNAAQAA